jgi:ribonuclease VapC
MIVDTSALVAILMKEPESRRLLTAITSSSTAKLPASCHLEASMVILGRKCNSDALRDLDLLIAMSGMVIVSFTTNQSLIAREAFKRFGKGRHAAGLNFGDCMSYALAKETGEKLLFKDTDFSLTDVPVAYY